MDLQPTGATMPSIVFFDPLPVFADTIKAMAPSVVIDVGAGMGRMSKVLHDAGLRVIAIDICERPTYEHTVYPLDAMMFQYPPNSLPIMARPCHGPWIDHAVDEAMKTVPKMLYVGLKRNLADDLHRINRQYTVTKMNTPVGRQGEIIVQIQRKDK